MSISINSTVKFSYKKGIYIGLIEDFVNKELAIVKIISISEYPCQFEFYSNGNIDETIPLANEELIVIPRKYLVAYNSKFRSYSTSFEKCIKDYKRYCSQQLEKIHNNEVSSFTTESLNNVIEILNKHLKNFDFLKVSKKVLFDYISIMPQKDLKELKIYIEETEKKYIDYQLGLMDWISNNDSYVLKGHVFRDECGKLIKLYRLKEGQYTLHKECGGTIKILIKDGIITEL